MLEWLRPQDLTRVVDGVPTSTRKWTQAYNFSITPDGYLVYAYYGHNDHLEEEVVRLPSGVVPVALAKLKGGYLMILGDDQREWYLYPDEEAIQAKSTLFPIPVYRYRIPSYSESMSHHLRPTRWTRAKRWIRSI